MSSVLTVILNWRTPDMTLRAAASALTAMEGIPGGIVIVDNDSGDGSFERMKAEATARGWAADDRLRVIQSGHNGGFGAGNNVGIRAGLPDGSAPTYVYVLNSDAFPRPDAIRCLRDHLEAHPTTGFAGSYLEGEDGAPHRTAFRFPSALAEFEASARFGPISRLLRRQIVAQPIPQTSTRVDWLAGASLMMRQSVLDDIGLFDENFFLYFEETELSHRAAKAGHPSDYVRESIVTHIGSVSTGMKTWARMPGYWFDSRRYYFTKVHGRAYAALATLMLVLGLSAWRLRLLVQSKPEVDPPHFLRDLIAHALRAPSARPKPAPLRQGT